MKNRKTHIDSISIDIHFCYLFATLLYKEIIF